MERNDDLERAVLDDPDDDTPRLVYADWLEERSDPRGPFIRAQCELASLPMLHPDRGRLRAHAAELLARHRAEWLGPLKDVPWPLEFRRGFVERVTITEGFDRDRLLALFAQAPIRSLRALLNRAEAVALSVPALLGRLRSLDLNGSDDLGDEGVGRLASSPSLSGVRRLSLASCGVGRRGAAALAASPYVAGLERLDLSNSNTHEIHRRGRVTQRWALGDRGAEALAASPHFNRLEHLHLRGCQIGASGIRIVANSPRLPALKLLLIDGNRYDRRNETPITPRPGLKLIV